MFTSLMRSASTLLGAIVLSMTLAAQPAIADPDDELAIFNAIVDDGAGEITITGQGFSVDQMVTFNGAVAMIVGTPTANEIVIGLPFGTPPPRFVPGHGRGMDGGLARVFRR